MPQLVAQLYRLTNGRLLPSVSLHGVGCEILSGASQVPSSLQMGGAPALGQDGPLQSYMVDNAAAAGRAVASAARPSMVSRSAADLYILLP